MMDVEFVDEKSDSPICTMFVSVPNVGDSVFFCNPDQVYSEEGVSEYRVLSVERYLYKSKDEDCQCATVRVIHVGNTNS